MTAPADLLAFFQSRLDGSLELLRHMVEMESHSRDKAGIDAFAEFLGRKLEESSLSVEIVNNRERGNTLRARWRSGFSAPPVLLLGHLDTVWAPGTIFQRPFRIEGGKAHGPGVFDMKGGILVLLLLASALAENKVGCDRDLVFFFSPDEEIGSEAALPILTESARGCRAVLCLEPPLPGGRAKTFRKGVGEFRVRVQGVAAHAGVDHEKGSNAILELSLLVQRLQSLTDYERGITLNVGTIRGGSATNVVPADAEAAVDFRVSTVADGERLDRFVRGWKPTDPRCILDVQGGLNRPPLERTDSVVRLFEEARRCAGLLGMELGEGATGGGSDGSFTAALGIPTLDGLGVAGDGAHAIHEHILVEDIPRRAALLTLLARSV